MANPQPDQHTRIANELLDQIPFYKFNGSQLSIIMVVWRYTYGWSRKDHDLSVTFLHERTGLAESTVKQELKTLLKSSVLIVTKPSTQNSARRLSFNKDYESWNFPKRGESMGNEFESGVGNRDPRNDESGVCDYHPHEVCDCDPQVITPGYAITPPKKESLLKKSFKENVELFETFWSKYPRKISKQAALKAWTKLCKEDKFDAGLIIRNTENFAKTHELLGTSKIYILHPSTYLNQKRYEDFTVVDPEGILNEQKQLSKQDRNKSLLQQKMEEAHDEERNDQPLIDYHDGLPFG